MLERKRSPTRTNSLIAIGTRWLKTFARLIRAHPADPAVFEGIILLPGLMRSFLDDDLLKIVRDQFMDDPRMGRLCTALPYRQETWAGEILEGVAAKHPDRKVRGQATYALGMWSRYRAQQWSDGREPRNRNQSRGRPTRGGPLSGSRRTTPTSLQSTERFGLPTKPGPSSHGSPTFPNLRIGKVAPGNRRRRSRRQTAEAQRSSGQRRRRLLLGDLVWAVHGDGPSRA